VRFGAHTAVVITYCGVRHMGRMVRRIEVNTIPARGEVDFRSEIGTGSRGEPRGFKRSTIPHTHDGNGCVREVGVVLGASVRVASNHSKAIGESQRNDGLVADGSSGLVIARSLLVVMCRSCVFHQGVLIILVVVQLGYPVVAVVQRLVAGGGSRVLGRSY